MAQTLSAGNMEGTAPDVTAAMKADPSANESVPQDPATLERSAAVEREIKELTEERKVSVGVVLGMQTGRKGFHSTWSDSLLSEPILCVAGVFMRRGRLVGLGKGVGLSVTQ